MNKIILALLMVLIFLEPNVAMAAEPDYNATYAPQITTGFTVTITANVSGRPETAMNFTGKAGTIVYPTGTNNGKNRWGYIYNTGSERLSFQMASPTPTNIILKVDAKSDMIHSFSVTKALGHPSGTNWNGWRYVPYQSSADIFAVVTFDLNAKKNFNVEVSVTSQNDQINDTTPPTTNISLSGTLGNNDWYISNVIVTLSRNGYKLY